MYIYLMKMPLKNEKITRNYTTTKGRRSQGGSTQQRRFQTFVFLSSRRGQHMALMVSATSMVSETVSL